MKLKMRPLVVALAIMGASPAHAFMVDGTNANGSSLLLIKYDRDTNISATFNLGFNYSDFSLNNTSFSNGGAASLTNQTWNLTTGNYADAWTTFTSQATATNVRWGVIAVDSTGTGTGQRGIIQTYNDANSPTPPNISTSVLATQLGTVNNYINDGNFANDKTVTNQNTVPAGEGGAHVADGRQSATPRATGTSNILNLMGSDAVNAQGGLATASYDQSMDVYERLGGSNVLQPSTLVFLENEDGERSTFRLSQDGTLTFVALGDNPPPPPPPVDPVDPPPPPPPPVDPVDPPPPPPPPVDPVDPPPPPPVDPVDPPPPPPPPVDPVDPPPPPPPPVDPVNPPPPPPPVDPVNPPPPTSQQIINQSVAAVGQGVRAAISQLTLASNFANMNTYDCNLFNEKGACISVGGQQTYVDNPSANMTSAVVVAGYKVSPTLRVGGFLNRMVNSNTGSTIDISNNTPLMGLFAVWNQNENQLGYQLKIANAYQDLDVSTRRFTPTSEVRGKTDIVTNSYVGELSYSFLINEDQTFVRPYAAMRYTKIKQDAFTERGNEALRFSALEDRSTAALVGVKLNHKLTDQVNLTGSIGIEHSFSQDVDDLTATGATSVAFNSSIKRTRPVASVGLNYMPAKNQRIAADVYYQELPFQNTGATTAYVNYVIGF